MSLRILLADDHQMFREALRILLERNSEFSVVAETGDGLKVLELARQTSPDIVCMDIDMPGMKGIEITHLLCEALPETRVIALSVFSNREYVTHMLNAGASAYVTKAQAGVELLRAIDAVSRNRSYLCPDATDAVRQAMVIQGDEKKGDRGTVKLGPREVQVLRLVAVGLTSQEIADQLHIALSTVEVHRRNIMRKLEVNSVVALTHYAIRNGLVANA